MAHIESEGFNCRHYSTRYFRCHLMVYHQTKTLTYKQYPIPDVVKEPATEEEDRIGDLNLGHPVARLLIRYRVLLYWAQNPPDPRGDKMCSRPAPYFIHVSTKELALALGISVRTVQRAMQTIHEEMQLKLRSQPTVDEFCEMCGYKEDDVAKIHQNLAYIREGKWKKIKDLHKKKDEDEK